MAKNDTHIFMVAQFKRFVKSFIQITLKIPASRALEAGILYLNIDQRAKNYAFFLRVKKPLRGFSLTTRSSGKSHGVPLLPSAVLVKK